MGILAYIGALLRTAMGYIADAMKGMGSWLYSTIWQPAWHDFGESCKATGQALSSLDAGALGHPASQVSS